MADNLEPDYQRVVDDVGRTRFLAGTAIEIVRESHSRHPPRHVLFDFDGTLLGYASTSPDGIPLTSHSGASSNG